MAFVFLRDLLDQVVSLDLKDQEEKRSVYVSFPYLFAPQREIGNGDCMLVNVDLSPSFTCRDPKGRLVLEGSLDLQGCRSDIHLLYNNRDLLLLHNNQGYTPSHIIMSNLLWYCPAKFFSHKSFVEPLYNGHLWGPTFCLL